MGKTDKMICVQVLLPALLDTKKQGKMTEDCKKSLISVDNCIKVTLDTKKYKTAVAGVWNHFLDTWRGKSYNYLMIVANDTQADVHAIDYMVKAMEENPDAGMITGKVTRDMKEFKKGYGQSKYEGRLDQGLLDPACFVLRKGVIETVGRIDEYFPREFVERDYIYRMKLAEYDIIQLENILWYHPPYAGTIGNDHERLQIALRKYQNKWGGDANYETFTHPFQDLSLNFTYTRK